METVNAQRDRGTVKFFNAAKGFGFISLIGNDETVFVHYKQIMAKNDLGQIVPFEGYRQLKDGQQVEFEIEQVPRGFQAVRVVAI